MYRAVIMRMADPIIERELLQMSKEQMCEVEELDERVVSATRYEIIAECIEELKELQENTGDMN